jgi:hypothetical protein
MKKINNPSVVACLGALVLCGCDVQHDYRVSASSLHADRLTPRQEGHRRRRHECRTYVAARAAARARRCLLPLDFQGSALPATHQKARVTS